MQVNRTQVGIIGGGPAGLLLARLLRRQGIDTVILERRTREYVEGRVRAGVLEQGTVDVLRDAAVCDNLEREGLVHSGFSIAFNGRLERIDLLKGTGNKTIWIYGQTELTCDLYRALLDEDDARIIFEAEDVTPSGFLDGNSRISYRLNGEATELECDFIAGCDGYYGASRRSVPAGSIREFERIYPFQWLGVLADVPPVDDELIYAAHSSGFALYSMRPGGRSRNYIQCGADDRIADWTAEELWNELRRRLPEEQASLVQPGSALEMGITPLRSFVAEPMRFGSMFLAGDAAHIVPPTGAKGLNLAVSDIFYLSRALSAYYLEHRDDLLDRYSAVCLDRVWKAVRFSWWLTALTHRFDVDALEHKLQIAELNYIFGSDAGRTMLAENYVGLPLEDFS